MSNSQNLALPAVATALTAALTELGIPADRLTDETRLREDLELDSTELVQLSLEMARLLNVRVKFEGNMDLTFSKACHLVLSASGIAHQQAI